MIFLVTFSAKFKFLNVIDVIGCLQLQLLNEHVAVAEKKTSFGALKTIGNQV